MNKPVIGITANLGEAGNQLATAYSDSVLRAGGMPVILPAALCDAEAILDRIDGLLLSGGGDLNPLLLGQEPIPQLHSVSPERDDMEMPLARLAIRRQLPVLGICRGVQVIAAAMGGDVYQDLYTQHSAESHLKHSQDMPRQYASHTVSIDAGTLLAQVMGAESVAVNSFHHQAVSRVPSGMRVCATAADGIIEAIEDSLEPEYVNTLGVQWHPECMTQGAPLFEWLVQRAGQYAEARRLHSRIVTLDSHQDTPMLLEHGVDFGGIDPRALVTLPRMREGGLDAGIMVAYLPQGELTDEGHEAAFSHANVLLDWIERLGIATARTPDDILQHKRAGQPCVMLGVENGYAIGTDLSHIDHFAQRGCVYITLCHNGDNLICDSARGKGTHGGLSEWGAKVVERMNQCGMMVDLSHAAETSFFDALKASATPIICSHSSARALCDHPRNLTDEQLRAIAQCGGVAQCTLYHGFLSKADNATIADAMRHLEHMVRVAGVEHVGLGSDFDGDGGIPGLANASELMNYTTALMRRRYNEDDISALWGGNLLRVMRQAQNYTSR